MAVKKKGKDDDSVKSCVYTTKRIDEIIDKGNLGIPLKRNEKIWFNNELGVRKANLAFAMTASEVEEYAKCKLSVKYFTQKYCKIKREDGTIGDIKLREYQKNIIDLFDKNRFSILMCSRQTGKTITASMFILWYVTFHSDKGIMIVANKASTVIEIIDKIKSIYLYLPFFLKQGAKNWSQRAITFENGCRIKSEAGTKSAAIGFTINLLYFDEFAHVQQDILKSYYTSAVPTVSSIENSKIIITSTPLGYNLFYELVTEAENLARTGESGPQNYKPMRVYWWQVEGRRDTKLFPKLKEFERFELKVENVIKFLEKELMYETYIKKDEHGNCTYYIKFDMNDIERTRISTIRKIRYKTLSLLELFNIANWEEEQTTLIGGEDGFKQEYDIKFITSDRVLFDDLELEKIKSNSMNFKYDSIPLFDKKINFTYKQLEFIDDINIFDIRKSKDYFILAGIDLAEGLGKDYTTMNIFKLRMKDREFIKKNRDRFNSIYDYFQLEQIGLFRSNFHSVKEFSLIFYMLIYELFDPEKCKVALEYNTFGGEFLAHLPHIFEGNNNYSTAPFARYYHNKDATEKKIGLKISSGDGNQNKKSLVKNFQDAVTKSNLIFHHYTLIHELSIFTRQDTPSGDYTYKSESGNDDCVMSIVNLSSLFNTTSFKDIVDIYMNEHLSQEDRNIIMNSVLEKDDTMATNYGSLIGARSKILNKGQYNKKYNRPNYNPFTNPYTTKNIDTNKINKLY